MASSGVGTIVVHTGGQHDSRGRQLMDPGIDRRPDNMASPSVMGSVIPALAGLLLAVATIEAEEDVPVVEYPARARYEAERRLVLPDFTDGGTFSGGRRIRVQLPPGYHDSDERYRVLYLFDGWLFLSMTPNTTTYKTLLDADLYHDQLLEDRLIHPAILVAIDNGWYKLREYELTPPLASGPSETQGGLEENHRFIVQQLKPYIDATFRTLPGAEHTGVAGRSFGGIAAFHLAYNHPEVYGLAGCMSSSFWWDGARLQERVLSETTRSSARFWIQDGSFDSWDRSYPVYRAMLGRGWVEGDDVAYFLVYGGKHGQEMWNSQMRHMLHFLLRKERPRLIGIRATRYDDGRARSIDLERDGKRAYVMVDLLYEGGFRLNAGSPVLDVQDTTVVQLEDEGLHRLRGRGPGRTSITAHYQGHESEIVVLGDQRHWIKRTLSRLVPW